LSIYTWSGVRGEEWGVRGGCVAGSVDHKWAMVPALDDRRTIFHSVDWQFARQNWSTSMLMIFCLPLYSHEIVWHWTQPCAEESLRD
jgi:hypothetical protein